MADQTVKRELFFVAAQSAKSGQIGDLIEGPYLDIEGAATYIQCRRSPNRCILSAEIEMRLVPTPGV